MTTDDHTPDILEPETPAIPDPAEPSQPARNGLGLGLGQIVTGAILIMIGLAWLFEAADWLSVPWRGLLAGALIVVGVALMYGARSGSHGGLIGFGIFLAILLSLSSAISVLADIPFTGGIGEQRHTITVDLESEYRWGIGSMTLDLRDLEEPPVRRTIEASVAIGELVVYVPEGFEVTVDAHAGIGEARVFGDKSSGFDADAAADAAEGALILDLDVAIGKVEVRR